MKTEVVKLTKSSGESFWTIPLTSNYYNKFVRVNGGDEIELTRHDLTVWELPTKIEVGQDVEKTVRYLLDGAERTPEEHAARRPVCGVDPEEADTADEFKMLALHAEAMDEWDAWEPDVVLIRKWREIEFVVYNVQESKRPDVKSRYYVGDSAGVFEFRITTSEFVKRVADKYNFEYVDAKIYGDTANLKYGWPHKVSLSSLCLNGTYLTCIDKSFDDNRLGYCRGTEDDCLKAAQDLEDKLDAVFRQEWAKSQLLDVSLRGQAISKLREIKHNVETVKPYATSRTEHRIALQLIRELIDELSLKGGE